jgi:hypothetical protein
MPGKTRSLPQKPESSPVYNEYTSLPTAPARELAAPQALGNAAAQDAMRAAPAAIYDEYVALSMGPEPSEYAPLATAEAAGPESIYGAYAPLSSGPVPSEYAPLAVAEAAGPEAIYGEYVPLSSGAAPSEHAPLAAAEAAAPITDVYSDQLYEEAAPAQAAPPRRGAAFDAKGVVPAVPAPAEPVRAQLGAHYAGEHEQARFRGGGKVASPADGGKTATVKTQTTTEGDREKLALHAEDGLLHRSGQRLDTKGAKPGLLDAAADRMIYALSPDGTMMAEDALSASRAGHADFHGWQAERAGLRAAGKSNEAIDAERPDLAAAPDTRYFHHSSFQNGGDVLGAGDLQVDDGRVKAISNESGHYHPGAQHLVQSMEHLDGLGVEMGTAKVDYNAGDQGVHRGLHGGEFMKSGGNLPLMAARAQMREQIRGKGRKD